MIFNVAQLIKSPIGTTQTVQLDSTDEFDLRQDGVESVGPIVGQVKLHRTNQGIYAAGTVTISVRLACTRCLLPFTTTLAFPFREEFYPTIDVNTGLPVAAPDSEVAFPIDRHHELDMREALRQNALLAVPTRTLCREDCAGLCPQCGHDLNDGPCGCQPDASDDRFAPLRALLAGADASFETPEG